MMNSMMNDMLSGWQNPSNSRGETVSSQIIYPKMKTVQQPSENIVCLSHKHNKTTVRVPPSEIMIFLCQEK